MLYYKYYIMDIETGKKFILNDYKKKYNWI